MIDWLIDWLNQNTGAVQGISTVLLVVVTLGYVLLTRQISGATRAQAEATRDQANATLDQAKATREQAEATRKQADDTHKQAEASVDMVGEMTKQRLAADRPYLLIDISVESSFEWLMPETKNMGSDEARDIAERAYPKSLACRILNAGRGPALDVQARFLHPFKSFPKENKGFVLPGETWPTNFRDWLFGGVLVEGFAKWLTKNVKNSDMPPADMTHSAFDGGVVVTYKDIHDVARATYQRVGIGLSRTNSEPWYGRLTPDEQHTVRMKQRRHFSTATE